MRMMTGMMMNNWWNSDWHKEWVELCNQRPIQKRIGYWICYYDKENKLIYEYIKL